MTSRVEMGKGVRHKPTVNLHDIDACDNRCEYYKSPEKYDCVRYNGHAIIVFYQGITRITVSEVEKSALCLEK